MPVTFVNRPDPVSGWGSALTGLSSALSAYQQYKSDEREHKLRVDEAARRREDSEAARKSRDLDDQMRHHQLDQLARTEGEETETLRQALGTDVEAPLAGIVTQSGGSLAMAPGATTSAMPQPTPPPETMTAGVLTGITPGEKAEGELTTAQRVKGKKKLRETEEERAIDLTRKKSQADWITLPRAIAGIPAGTRVPANEMVRLMTQKPTPREGFTIGRARYEYDQQTGLPRVVAREAEEAGTGSKSTKSVYDKQTKENVLRTEAQISAEPDRYIAPKTATATGEGGKPLLGGELNKISEFIQGLETIKSLGPKIAKKGGTGLFQGLSARVPDFITEYTGIGTEAKGLRANLDLAKQIVGKALEGGVLRKEDEAKYQKILVEVKNAPQLADEKLLGLIDQLSRDSAIYLSTLKKGGRNVSEFEEEIQSYRKPKEGATSVDQDPLGLGAVSGGAVGNPLGIRRPGVK